MFILLSLNYSRLSAYSKSLTFAAIILCNFLLLANKSFGQFKAMEGKEQKSLVADILVENRIDSFDQIVTIKPFSDSDRADSFDLSYEKSLLPIDKDKSNNKKYKASYSPLYNFTDSSLTAAQVKRRTTIMAISQASIYGGLMVGLYKTWYSQYPQSKFHAFNDMSEWKGMDKIGHVYSAYAQSKAGMELWRWTGIDRKRRIWYGGLAGVAYQTVIETLDGFSAEWGWSWGDIGANIAGSAMVIGQELAWDEQRVQLKWSFHRKKYADPSLNMRTDELFGSTTAERILKDYNGQTYWLSTTLKPFFPKSKIPEWLQLSVGTGTEGLFGGTQNIGINKEGVTTFYRPDIKRYRQWYLAPDIDLSRIKTKKKGIRIALDILNILKFPTPSLEYSNGSFGVNWFHF